MCKLKMYLFTQELWQWFITFEVAGLSFSKILLSIFYTNRTRILQVTQVSSWLIRVSNKFSTLTYSSDFTKHTLTHGGRK